MHRRALDSVDGTSSVREYFSSPRLMSVTMVAADGADELQDALANVEAPCGRREVLLDEVLYSVLHAEELAFEELVVLRLALPGVVDPGSHDHVVQSRVRKVGDPRVLGHNVNAVFECTFPSELVRLRAMFLCFFENFPVAHSIPFQDQLLLTRCSQTGSVLRSAGFPGIPPSTWRSAESIFPASFPCLR